MILDKQSLGRLVHNQIEKLIFGKYGDAAVGTDVHDLWAKRGMTTLEFMGHFRSLNDVINKWEPREVPDSHTPVLVVTPFSLVSVKDQVERLEYEGKNAWPCTLEENLIRNLEKGIPEEPYLLIDIEDGRERINHATEASEQLIRKQKRHALTVNEGVALDMQVPDVLREDYILELAGSRYGQRLVQENVPLPHSGPGEYNAWAPWGESATKTKLEPGIDRPILILESGAPRLCVRVPEDDGEGEFWDEGWGVPSCALRIDPRKY